MVAVAFQAIGLSYFFNGAIVLPPLPPLPFLPAAVAAPGPVTADNQAVANGQG